MTSKRCFFKMMREDFRHKIWMLALSVLGNMLAIPVVYLLGTGYGAGMDLVGSVGYLVRQANETGEFFLEFVMISGGFVAIAGALIVGLSGFRYVFHRNMVDTWHSLPVKRSTYFWINWLNGFLIWFVPFLVSFGFTLLLGLGRLSAIRGRLAGLVMNEEESLIASQCVTGGWLTANALISLLTLIVVFLLVYHLVLLAVMLCGNVLNTMVTAATLGVGAFSVYFLVEAFCMMYFDTFMGPGDFVSYNVAYASPLVSSILLLYRRVACFEAGEEFLFWGACILNLVIALALGALTYFAYLKRPSELAEQGLRIKPIRFLLQIAVSLAAAMGGWLLFYLIGDSAIIWGIFGAVLAGGVSFGVMDIIFHMEFRAFFAHKVLMGLTVAAGVFTGLLFYFDWLGYDTYLPDREAIAEIAVYDTLCSNRNYSYYAWDYLDEVHIRDSAAAYAFLESVVDRSGAEAEEDLLYFGESVFTRVTLKSGRTYYREYQVYHENSGPAYALFTSPEYLDANFRIGQGERRNYKSIRLNRAGIYDELQTDTQEGARLLEAVCEAYNQDLEENPDAFICGDGRLFCVIRLFDENRNSHRVLEIFEGMEHTREALRQHGFAQFAEPAEPEDIEEIQLSLGYRYIDDGDTWDPVAVARDVYGVYAKAESEETSEEKEFEPAGEAVDFGTYKDYNETEVILHITDEEEIRELLGLISYDRGRNYSGGVFRTGSVDYITLVLSGEEGEESFSVYIPYGALPEKYILRFGSLQD
ncbi:MAG: hypothetical protein K2J60_16765 [Acetatifactor sp.]|nr:hypothetical protein [Acetatifactor sp.]